MSPCFRRLSLGIPWQTTWFTEVQIDFGKAAIIERRRDRLLHIHDVIVAALIELIGRHARDDVRCDHIEHIRGQAAGNAHLFLLGGGF